MTPSRPESQATPCDAPPSVHRAAGPNPLRVLHSLERFIPRNHWESVSVFPDGGVKVVFSDSVRVASNGNAAKDTSGLPSRDASRLNNDDDGTTKTAAAAPKSAAQRLRRRVSKGKRLQKVQRWVLRGIRRNYAALRIQNAFRHRRAALRIQRAFRLWRLWRTSQVSRSDRPSSTMASIGISRADPTPPTSTSTGTSRASRTSTRTSATVVPRTSTATNAPPPKSRNRPRDKTKQGVS